MMMKMKSSRWILCLLALTLFMSAGCNRTSPVPIVECEQDQESPTEETIETIMTGQEACESDEAVSEVIEGEPGFFLDKGTLYCRGEDGKLLCNAEKDGLFFSESGAYSSGNAELDVLVANTLALITEANPEHSGLELLRDVYDYMVDNYSYLGRRIEAAEGEPWEPEAAIIMLETGKGNCHHYAAAFWALSRGLGYNAVTHTNPNGQKHSWTEIEIDSCPYIFDPQLAVHWKDDRFMLSYESCRNRNYTVYLTVYQ